MGRGKGKGKKSNASTGSEDPASGGEDSLPYKRRGRPQKPFKEEINEEEIEKMSEEYGESVDAIFPKKENTDQGTLENGKKRRRHKQGKYNPLQEEISADVRSNIEDAIKSNGFRQNGSRRKSKPRRAADAGVDYK